MDFLRYAEHAAALVNTGLAGVDDLRAHLDDRPELRERATDRDCMVLRRFQRELRPTFEAASNGDVPGAVDHLNGLLARHPVTPQVSGHGGGGLHLHVTSTTGAVADQLLGEALLGLATLVCELGANRLGVCRAPRCEHVFVDISPNQSRRYCSEKCSSRANVAAYRARQKALAASA